MEISNFQNGDEAAKASGLELSKLIDEANSPVLLLVSAGSALKVLDYTDPIFDGREKVDITVSVLDERFSDDPSINNFELLRRTGFYNRTSKAGVKFTSVDVIGGGNLESFARRIENNLKTWVEENPAGKIFVTLGMGADGHTAGIMPFPEDEELFKELFESDAWVVGYDGGKKSKYRLRATVTNTFLKNKVDGAVGYVVGEEKKEKFEQTQTQGSVAEIPARVWQRVKNLKVFTDL